MSAAKQKEKPRQLLEAAVVAHRDEGLGVELERQPGRERVAEPRGQRHGLLAEPREDVARRAGVILDLGDSLSGRLLAYDAMEQSFRTFKVRRDPQCPACSLDPEQVVIAEYDELCMPHVAEAPVSAFVHRINNLDTLGTDEREWSRKPCSPSSSMSSWRKPSECSAIAHPNVCERIGLCGSKWQHSSPACRRPWRRGFQRSAGIPWPRWAPGARTPACTLWGR